MHVTKVAATDTNIIEETLQNDTNSTSPVSKKEINYLETFSSSCSAYWLLSS